MTNIRAKAMVGRGGRYGDLYGDGKEIDPVRDVQSLSTQVLRQFYASQEAVLRELVENGCSLDSIEIVHRAGQHVTIMQGGYPVWSGNVTAMGNVIFPPPF